MKKKLCEYCGKEFIFDSIYDRKTCSKKCASKLAGKTRSISSKKEITCKECGKCFKVCNCINRSFCSLSCSSIYHNKKRKGYRDVKIQCAYCNKDMILTKGYIKKHNKKGFKNFYCSKECSGFDKKGEKRPNISKSLIEHNKKYGWSQVTWRGGIRKDLEHYFRSSWEANYARILNYLDKNWSYEPETFVLNIDGKKTTYTPDFYLSDEDVWVEVKGFWRNDLSKKKYDVFSETHNTILVDEEKYLELQEEYKDKVLWELKRYKKVGIKLIGEVGINANRDLKIVKKLIDNIKKYNWDFVKFQKRHVETVIPKQMWNDLKKTPWGEIKYIDYKKHLEFSKEDYNVIDRYCKQVGVKWFASAWDLKSQQFLDGYNLEYNKIASAMLTYEPLIQHIANQQKMTFISTASATLDEIDKIVDIFRNRRCPFVLMHCVGLYPCPLEHLNLNRIITLQNRYSCPVGYSGHSEGAFDAIVASMFGIKYIEKHITLNRSMFGSDQSASIEPSGMRFISKHIDHIPRMLGKGQNKPLDDEIKNIEKMRWWKDEDNI